MRTVLSHPVVGPFAERVLASDLPRLDAAKRGAAVAFITSRVDVMPSFTRFGVLAIGSLYRVILAVPGGWHVARLLASKPLPLLGEYPRLVRSLGYAYLWERWPDLTPDGSLQ